MKDLVIGGKRFSSRFFLGTGKFASGDLLREALAASGTELVTTALTRVHEGDAENDDILRVIDRSKVEVMLNTSGARNAAEAIRIARLGKAAGYNWIKIEVHPDARYLLPDPVETLEAVKECAKMGMVVLPYINADPVLARHCEDAGAAAVMPLGSPIGSNRGIRTRDMIEIIVEQSHIPVVVDAGILARSGGDRARRGRRPREHRGRRGGRSRRDGEGFRPRDPGGGTRGPGGPADGTCDCERDESDGHLQVSVE